MSAKVTHVRGLLQADSRSEMRAESTGRGSNHCLLSGARNKARKSIFYIPSGSLGLNCSFTVVILSVSSENPRAKAKNEDGSVAALATGRKCVSMRGHVQLIHFSFKRISFRYLSA